MSEICLCNVRSINKNNKKVNEIINCGGMKRKLCLLIVDGGVIVKIHSLFIYLHKVYKRDMPCTLLHDIIPSPLS